jgi:hypothetical protein
LLGRGGGDFGPPGRERARGRGWRPNWPSSEGETAGDGAVSRGPHASEGGGVNGADGNRREGVSTGVRPAVEFLGASPPWVRFRGGEAVVRHGRGQGIIGVGSI